MAKRVLFIAISLMLVLAISTATMVYAVNDDASVIKSASYEIIEDKIFFTVVTEAGDYNRIKVTTADNLGGSLGVGTGYVVDENGDYVWTFKVAAPTETTTYAFDLRSSATGKYLKKYFTTEVNLDDMAVFKSAEYEIIGDKIYFTVVTAAGDYNRIKVTTADNLGGSLGVGTGYVVDENGDYVWTFKVAAPTETTTYAFDLRSSTTIKYIKDYYFKEVSLGEPEVTDVFKSASYKMVVEFTLTTAAGNYSAIKVTTPDNLSGSLGESTTYTIDQNGNYVWSIKAAAPTGTTNYAFVLKSSVTGEYLNNYHLMEVTVGDVALFKSATYETDGDKIIFKVVTAAGDYSRIKVTTADNLGGSLAVATTYTTDQNGNYVWSIKAPAPTETTTYAFDLRSSTTGKYLKDYYKTEVKVEARTHTVTFVDWDGTVLKAEEVEAGKAATAPQAPSRSGYVFAGWSTSFEAISADLTVTATYTKAHNQICFEFADNGNGTTTATMYVRGDVNLYGLEAKLYLALSGMTLENVAPAAAGAGASYNGNYIILSYVNTTGKNLTADTALLTLTFTNTADSRGAMIELRDVDIFDDQFNNETYTLAGNLYRN